MLKNFKEAPALSTKLYGNAIQTTGRFIQSRAMHYAPVGKYKGGGTLRQKIKARSLGPFSFAILADTKYAAAVNDGSKPHVILPRTKPFLAFQIGGRWVRTKRVNHPGTKPTHFFTNAAKDGEAYLDRAMQAANQTIINKLKA